MVQEQPDKFVLPWMLKFLPRKQGQRDLVMALLSLLLGLLVFCVLFNLFGFGAGVIGDAIVVGFFGEHYLRRLIARFPKHPQK